MGRCSWALKKCGTVADIGNFYHAVAWLFKFVGRPSYIQYTLYRVCFVRCRNLNFHTDY
jgi:hypothetical protein